MGIFTIRVPFFGHKTQGFCFCYFPNIKSTWNKCKWKILDNSNYDNFHSGGDFSHGYVIMHKYFGKKPKMQKISTYIFVYNLTCFMHENFLHMLLTFGATNCKQVNEYIKNQPKWQIKWIVLLTTLST